PGCAGRGAASQGQNGLFGMGQEVFPAGDQKPAHAVYPRAPALGKRGRPSFCDCRKSDFMTSQMTRLVVVAYPMDETLVFSEVCRGADIVAVASMYQNVSHDKLAGDFREAGAVLGARGTSYLGLPEQESFPAEALEDALTSYGPYERVYTHSPLDEDSFRVYVTLTVSKVFGTVWVPATGAPPMEVHVLTRDLFLRKVEIMNQYYS